MNYKHVYMQIVSAAKNQQKLGLRPKNKYYQKKNFQNQYFEFHHILPRSLFPNWSTKNSNIVPLTAREHFFCHRLLLKIYPCPEMFLALKYMSVDHKHSSRLYEKERLQIIESCRIAGSKASRDYDQQARCRKMWETRRLRRTDHPKGFKHTEETRRKMSLAKKGIQPLFGKQFQKGEHWFTNGVKNVHSFECPDGFWEGRTPKRKPVQKGISKSLHQKEAIKAFKQKQSADYRRYKEIHPYIKWREFLKIYKDLNFN